MAESTDIEWTDATVNFWWGCTKVGPGCDHCYAEAMSNRFGGAHWGLGAPRRKIASAAAMLRRLDNGYSWFFANNDRSRNVFVQSMSDLFDLEVPLEWFGEAWAEIAIRDRLNIQIVTKRISAVEKRLAQIAEHEWPGFPPYGLKPVPTWPKHAGLLVTVCNQVEADRDIPRLLALKAALGIPWVGISAEPLLGPLDLTKWLPGLDWVIVGGESGRHARAMHPHWARFLRDQCAAAGVPFYFKQWGEWAPSTPEDAGSNPYSGWRCLAGHPHLARAEELYPENGAAFVARVGKRAAGRLLDGVLHDAYPEPRV